MRAAFLDRDGVINELVYFEEAGIIDSPFHEDQFRLERGAGSGIRILNDAGYKVFVISNQPCVAKGHCSRERLDRITERMHALLAGEGARVDAVYYCLHHPDARVPEYRGDCECRKPKPGLLNRAAAEHDIDMKASFFIGDSITDVQAGLAAGCQTVLIGRVRCDLCHHLEERGVKPDHIFVSLQEAAVFLQQMEGFPDAAVHRHC